MLRVHPSLVSPGLRWLFKSLGLHGFNGQAFVLIAKVGCTQCLQLKSCFVCGNDDHLFSDLFRDADLTLPS